MHSPTIETCEVAQYRVTLNKSSVHTCHWLAEAQELVDLHNSFVEDGFVVDGNTYTDPITQEVLWLHSRHKWCMRGSNGFPFFSATEYREYQLAKIREERGQTIAQIETLRSSLSQIEDNLKQLESRSVTRG